MMMEKNIYVQRHDDDALVVSRIQKTAKLIYIRRIQRGLVHYDALVVSRIQKIVKLLHIKRIQRGLEHDDAHVVLRLQSSFT
jgi:hypothetical protein